MRETLTEVARAIPATGKLLYRLVRDDRVDERKRAAVIAALAYAVLPFDLIPDRIPVIGKIDDLVIGAAAVNALFEAAGDDIISEHWDASPQSLNAIVGGAEALAGFLPRPLRRILRPTR